MARIPMFLNTTWKSPNGTVYKKMICNSKRGGCGEEFWTADKLKHRNHCFKDVKTQKQNIPMCTKGCGRLARKNVHLGTPRATHWCD